MQRHHHYKSSHKDSGKVVRAQLAARLQAEEFQSIMRQFADVDVLSPDERYAYGFALLKKGKLDQALTTWWQLFHKMGAEFDADYTALAEHVFVAAAPSADWSSAPLEQAIPLFLAARSLAPEAAATAFLRSRVLGELWDRGDFSTLGKLLDSGRETQGAAHVINLAKTRFWLWRERPTCDVAGFVSLYLTAAASFATQARARCPFAEGVAALERELHIWLSTHLKSTGQGEGSATGWRRLIEAQIGVILDAWSESEGGGGQGLLLPRGILPAPLYLTQLDPQTPLGQEINAWLTRLSPGVQAAYRAVSPKTYLQQFGLGDAKAFEREYRRFMEQVTRGVQLDTVGPLLKLEYVAYGMKHRDRRVLNLVKSMATELPSIKPHTNRVFLELVSHIRNEDKDAARAFWYEAVVDCAPLEIWEQSMRAKMVDVALEMARKRQVEGGSWTEYLRTAHDLTASGEVKATIQGIFARLAKGERLLDVIRTGTHRKVYKRFFQGKVTPAEIKEFIALIADTASLSYDWHPFWGEDDLMVDAEPLMAFRDFVAGLATEPKVDRIFPVSEFFADALQHPCPNCARALICEELPRAQMVWHLPKIVFPEAVPVAAASSPASIRHSSVLTGEDPFRILGVTPAADKAAILRATMERMRENSARMAEIRSAQAELFDPARRLAHEFLRYYFEGSPEEGEPVWAEATSRGRAAPGAAADLARIQLRGPWSHPREYQH